MSDDFDVPFTKTERVALLIRYDRRKEQYGSTDDSKVRGIVLRYEATISRLEYELIRALEEQS